MLIMHDGFKWPTWGRKAIDGAEGSISVPFRRGSFHELDIGAALIMHNGFKWPTWGRKAIDGVEGSISVPFRRGSFHGLDIVAACRSGTQKRNRNIIMV